MFISFLKLSQGFSQKTASLTRSATLSKHVYLMQQLGFKHTVCTAGRLHLKAIYKIYNLKKLKTVKT